MTDLPDATKLNQQNFSVFSFFQKYKNFFIILLTFILGIVLGVNYIKSTNQQSKPKDIVTIIGNGYIDVPADEIIVYARVTTKDTDEKRATDENEKIIKIVKDKLIMLGIPLTDTTFSTYTDNPYNYYPPISSVPIGSGGAIVQPEINKSNTYGLITSISVSAQNDTLAQKTVELLNSISGIQMDGNINYSLKDSTAFEQKARDQALLDAKNQIEAMKKIQNIKIGKVIAITDLKSISLQNSRKDGYYPPTESKKVYAEYGNKTVQVRASYEVKYEIQNSLFPF